MAASLWKASHILPAPPFQPEWTQGSPSPGGGCGDTRRLVKPQQKQKALAEREAGVWARGMGSGSGGGGSEASPSPALCVGVGTRRHTASPNARRPKRRRPGAGFRVGGLFPGPSACGRLWPLARPEPLGPREPATAERARSPSAGVEGRARSTMSRREQETREAGWPSGGNRGLGRRVSELGGETAATTPPAWNRARGREGRGGGGERSGTDRCLHESRASRWRMDARPGTPSGRSNAGDFTSPFRVPVARGLGLQTASRWRPRAAPPLPPRAPRFPGRARGAGRGGCGAGLLEPDAGAFSPQGCRCPRCSRTRRPPSCRGSTAAAAKPAPCSRTPSCRAWRRGSRFSATCPRPSGWSWPRRSACPRRRWAGGEAACLPPPAPRGARGQDRAPRSQAAPGPSAAHSRSQPRVRLAQGPRTRRGLLLLESPGSALPLLLPGAGPLRRASLSREQPPQGRRLSLTSAAGLPPTSVPSTRSQARPWRGRSTPRTLRTRSLLPSPTCYRGWPAGRERPLRPAAGPRLPSRGRWPGVQVPCQGRGRPRRRHAR